MEDLLSCPQCELKFTTKKLLALHQYHSHHRYSAESAYVQGSVCPGCLREFWTSLRLTQRLKYRPNRCFARVCGTRPEEAPVNIKMPTHLAGIKRLPCTRTHHGPLRPTPHQRERVALWTRLHNLRDHLREFGGGLDINDFPDITRTYHWTSLWTSDDCDEAVLQGHIMTLLSDCTERRDVAIAWLSNLCRTLSSDVACQAALAQHCKCLLSDLGVEDIVVQIQHLEELLAAMPFDSPEEYLREEVQFRQNRDRLYPIQSSFGEGQHWETEWRQRYIGYNAQPSPTYQAISHPPVFWKAPPGRLPMVV